MTDCTNPFGIFPVRVVIELGSNGGLVMEHYVDGQRVRTDLPKGLELFEIKEALAEKRRRNDAERERKLRTEQAKVDATSREVYLRTAHTHGTAFADRTIGRPKGLRASEVPTHRARVETKAEAKPPVAPKAKPVTAVDASAYAKSALATVQASLSLL